MLNYYETLMKAAKPALELLLRRRVRIGKEDPVRVQEKMGYPGHPRPEGKLIWVHAASVGEAQSALILIHRLLEICPAAKILVTTVTRTSAALMERKLPQRAFHQFYPLDHPDWTARFLDYWRPDMALWIESELWPSMLGQMKQRNIPAALINARMSDKSFKRWKIFGALARRTLGCFDIIAAQTDEDVKKLSALGAHNILLAGNIKYSAHPLSADTHELKKLVATIADRPTWIFASTHAPEESMAARIHQKLKHAHPDILTIVAPRHPSRRDEILHACKAEGLAVHTRGEQRKPPQENTDLYIADTMGELGLFYRVAPIAVIGRSFSSDGGGGHNPIEAAQLNCAVLYGPKVQFQQALFDELSDAGGALQADDASALAGLIATLLENAERLQAMQKSGFDFCRNRGDVLGRIINAIAPLMMNSGITNSPAASEPPDQRKQA